MDKPRVFVSSVVDGYEHIREAARAGVIAADMHPVLVNEDFPSLASSSRNACLDGIASCDVHILIIGARGGWTTPSGQTVLEEELAFAKRKKLPSLVFVQNIARDNEAERLEQSASDYVSGNFRRTFNAPEELTVAVTEALQLLSPAPRSDQMSTARFDDFPWSGHTGSSETQLHVRISPARDEEILSPPEMASSATERLLQELGHSNKVGLFSYSNRKTAETGDGVLTITEYSDHYNAGTIITFEEHGTLNAILSLPRKQGPPGNLTIGLVLPVEEIEEALSSVMSFYGELIAKLDPWQRQQQFFLNVALSDLGYKTLERSPEPRTSHSIRMAHPNAPVVAYDAPRPIARSDLTDPTDEMARATTLIVRKAAAQ